MKKSRTAARSGAAYSECTSHCSGQCSPACTGGGHCVPNIGVNLNRRPKREDMLSLLQAA